MEDVANLSSGRRHVYCCHDVVYIVNGLLLSIRLQKTPTLGICTS